jgi:hypothetical protein
VAFWRNGLAFAALTPITAGPRRPELRALRSRSGLFAVLAGLALALHFATWMPSVQLGSVATATALVARPPGSPSGRRRRRSSLPCSPWSVRSRRRSTRRSGNGPGRS